eukprot:NODE_1709_length_2397_cov_6.263436.p1 GENE.NODE_1709_length_2397_cov_6.263436~~NODE_1709_length_2397_cov_6.263436.p1  ORF type:complete len:682 (-),score=143.78 NODE_1709_length_2397_cov_6.263436:351-2138(-)
MATATVGGSVEKRQCDDAVNTCEGTASMEGREASLGACAPASRASRASRPASITALRVSRGGAHSVPPSRHVPSPQIEPPTAATPAMVAAAIPAAGGAVTTPVVATPPVPVPAVRAELPSLQLPPPVAAPPRSSLRKPPTVMASLISQGSPVHAAPAAVAASLSLLPAEGELSAAAAMIVQAVPAGPLPTDSPVSKATLVPGEAVPPPPIPHLKAATPRELNASVRLIKEATVSEPLLRSANPSALPPAALRDLTRPKCPSGHEMCAKVVQEMFLFWPTKYLSVNVCSRCDERITAKDARYRCALCDLNFCLSCVSDSQCMLETKPCETAEDLLRAALEVHFARKAPVEVLPGDVFLCGPDAWGIHHVVLSRGRMVPAEERVRKAISPGGDAEVYGCETVESNRMMRGEDTQWYQTCCYYVRNPETGVTQLVADMIPGSNRLEIYFEPVAVKVLLHPLRIGWGGPELDPEALAEVIKKASGQSKTYGRITAMQAFVTNQVKLNAADYPDTALRERLFEELQKRWQTPPICSSVVIMVWQMYFEAVHRSAGPAAVDLAVQRILEFVPLYSDKTTPSTLVEALTECGWMLRANLDAA